MRHRCNRAAKQFARNRTRSFQGFTPFAGPLAQRFLTLEGQRRSDSLTFRVQNAIRTHDQSENDYDAAHLNHDGPDHDLDPADRSHDGAGNDHGLADQSHGGPDHDLDPVDRSLDPVDRSHHGRGNDHGVADQSHDEPNRDLGADRVRHNQRRLCQSASPTGFKESLYRTREPLIALAFHNKHCRRLCQSMRVRSPERVRNTHRRELSVINIRFRHGRTALTMRGSVSSTFRTAMTFSVATIPEIHQRVVADATTAERNPGRSGWSRPQSAIWFVDLKTFANRPSRASRRSAHCR